MKLTHGKISISISIALASAIGLLTVSNVNAAEGGLYGGAVYGSSTIDTGITGLTGTASLDERGTGYRLFIGKSVSKNLSFEGFYADFGESSLTGNTGDQFVSGGTTYQFLVDNAKIAWSASGFGVNANFTHNFSNKSSLIGRLGILSWNSTLTVSGTNITGDSIKKSGGDIFYGLGYQHNFTNKVGLVVGYDMFKINEENVSTLSVGVNVNF